MKTTEWYPPYVNPVRDGVYQLHNTSTDMVFYANWHAGAWARGSVFASAAANTKTPSVVQNQWPWRGLTEKAA